MVSKLLVTVLVGLVLVGCGGGEVDEIADAASQNRPVQAGQQEMPQAQVDSPEAAGFREVYGDDAYPTPHAGTQPVAQAEAGPAANPQTRS